MSIHLVESGCGELSLSCWLVDQESIYENLSRSEERSKRQPFGTLQVGDSVCGGSYNCLLFNVFRHCSLGIARSEPFCGQVYIISGGIINNKAAKQLLFFIFNCIAKVSDRDLVSSVTQKQMTPNCFISFSLSIIQLIMDYIQRGEELD